MYVGCCGVREAPRGSTLAAVGVIVVGVTLAACFGPHSHRGVTPADMAQADANAVFDAGWDEKGLHDAIAITARMCFMQRIVEGHGFIPMTREVARENAEKRAKLGYVNLYPAFQKKN